MTWEIDLEAETPREAARQSLASLTDPGSIAHVFTVADADGHTPVVDLDA